MKNTSNFQMLEMLATDCQDLHEMGLNATGVYHLAKHGRDVLCEMEGGDGGWLVVQRRARVAKQVGHALGRWEPSQQLYTVTQPPFCLFLITISYVTFCCHSFRLTSTEVGTNTREVSET